MSMIPSNLARVPSFLASRIALGGMNQTNLALLRVQNSLSTFRSIQNPSEDPIRASGIFTLNNNLQAAEQYKSNLDFATSTLGVLDSNDGPLALITDQVRRAQELALGSIGAQASDSERQANRVEIESLIRSIFTQTNRSIRGLYLLGGSTATQQPVVEVSGGYRYIGRGSGLISDNGTADPLPLTIGGDNALGETSARQRGTAPLTPSVTAGTALADVRGYRGLGVAPGTINFSYNGGPAQSVDLTGARTVGDVAAAINGAVRQYEASSGTTVLGPGGITLDSGLNFDVAAGGALVFSDPPNGVTAADLGLTDAPYPGGAATTGGYLDPRLTLTTPVSALTSITLPLESVRLRMSGGGSSAVTDVDLSGATNIDGIRNAIETAVPGVRVQISADARGLDILNEVSGRTLSVEEVPGGQNTAEMLGLRTFSNSTAISTFNNGRGVRIIDGRRDPQSNLVSPTLNTDFRITLANGQHFDVDLRPGDMATVGSVIARINNEFGAVLGTAPNPSAPVLAPSDFVALVSDLGNGITLRSGLTGAITVTARNDSPAAEDLGLLELQQDGASPDYFAQDRTGIRVNNLFTSLVELRDALASNDSAGISLATEELTRAADRLLNARGVVGAYRKRVDDHLDQLESQTTLDQQMLSTLQDTDFAEAAVRLNNLNTQLQATLSTIGQTQGRTLFDFLR